jgi:iron complex outermembrane receptor protein
MLALAVVALAGGVARSANAAPASETTPAARDTFPRVVTLPPVEVSTTRFTATSPVARTTLSRSEAQSVNWGQDTPMALASLPGAYAYSDAGNGVGYSYLSIRGFPQRRISVLINGVPLNDPESHEVYWIDHPDLLSSAAEVTVQRGVGAALYGSAAVGGSVDITTSPFSHAPEQRVTVGYGSFETKRVSVESNSGDLPGGWNAYARYSRIESFGYREDSWSKLWSYTVSGRRVFGNQSVQANLYGGPEETHLAYYGLSPAALALDRRFNPLTYQNERDHFFEPHYELVHTWAPTDRVSVTHTLFWFDGKGYYDEQRFDEPLANYRLAPWKTLDPNLAPPNYYVDDVNGQPLADGTGHYTITATDVVRRRTIVDRHYGWIPRGSWQHAQGTLTLGGEMRFHDGRHYGEVKSGSSLPPGTPADLGFYDFHPQTMSTGLFLREEWTPASAWTVTADGAWRHQSYSMRRDLFDHVAFEQKYDFFLPRLGVTWRPGKRDLAVFASWAQTQREPALRDLYDGETPGGLPRYAAVSPATGLWVTPLIRPERASDWEAGASWAREWPGATPGRARTLSLAADVFRTDFRDELVDAGQFNTDLGYPEVANAARSLHQGVELSGRAESPVASRLRASLSANVSLSDNHFVDYVEFDDVGNPSRFDGNRIGLFPDAMNNVELKLASGDAWVAAATQSIGRIYLDNSEDASRSLAPRTVLNLSAGGIVPVGGSRLSLTLRVLNATNELYNAGGYGYTYLGVRYAEVIPAATRAVMGEVSVRF